MSALIPQSLGVGRCGWHFGGGRGSGASPFCPSLDMTTPLGLSRQHLSYLQEIGSGWFGKVSGLGVGGRGSMQPRGCTAVLCSFPCSRTTSHLLPASSPCLLSPAITLTSIHLSPAPTHPISPHLSVSASLLTPLITPPRHLALHAPVCPSFHPSPRPSDSGPVSLSPRVWWGTRVAVGYEGTAWKEGEVRRLWWSGGGPRGGAPPPSLEKAPNYNSHNALLKGRGVGKPQVLTPRSP